jgi:hypothetical protein
MIYDVAKGPESGGFTSPAQCWLLGYLYLTPSAALPPKLTFPRELGLPGLFKVHELHLPGSQIQPQKRHRDG